MTAGINDKKLMDIGNFLDNCGLIVTEKESCELEILSEVSKTCILSELIISLIRNSPKGDETERMPQPI